MTQQLSDQILQENQAILAKMLQHRFIEDLKNNQLTHENFARYLVFEGLFVESAIEIFAFATIKANTISRRRRLIAIQSGLANEQILYFENTFAALKIRPDGYDTSHQGVVNFRENMLKIARDNDYHEIIVAMFGAEWMYWSWSKQAALCPINNPFIKQWVMMHTTANFAAQALWLKTELDHAGQNMDGVKRSQLSKLFGKVQALEIAFHDAAYL